MAFVSGKNIAVLYDKFEHTDQYRQADISQEVDLPDSTTFGDSAREFIPTLRNGTVSLSGLFDGAADKVDEELSAAIAAATGSPTTVGMEGFANGKPVYLLSARAARYTTGGSVEDLVPVQVELQADGGIDRGVSLLDLASRAAGVITNGVSVDNSASSANGGVGHVHVTVSTLAGFSTNHLVQHSTDNSVWVDLVTFASLGASTTTSERKTVTGTVNRYVRGVVNGSGAGSGNITSAVFFARR